MTCEDCGCDTLSPGVCTDCSDIRFHNYPILKKRIDELTEIYPKIVSIVDGWQQIASAHGITNTEDDDKVMKKYVDILKKLGVLEDNDEEAKCAKCGSKNIKTEEFSDDNVDYIQPTCQDCGEMI